MRVECVTSRRATRGKKHPVTISADWSVETPHDLAAERVAAALGGFCSCLDLVDKVVPAVRDGAQLIARTRLPTLRRAASQGWTVPVEHLCRQCVRSWPDAVAAAEHVRSAHHQAGRYAASLRVVSRVLAAVADAWGPARVPSSGDRNWAGLVRDPGGITRLWRAGLHPDLVASWWRAAGVAEAMPVQFYLGVAFTDVDLDWLAATLRHAPDPDVAVWLAWTEGLHDTADPESCGRWLGEGLNRRSIEVLMRTGVSHHSAVRIAERSWQPVRTVATRLASWARAGCRPGLGDFALLERFGLADYRPSAAALDGLCREFAGLSEPPTRTHAGVMLALAGSRQRVRGYVDLGARHPQDIARMLDEPMPGPGATEREVG